MSWLFDWATLSERCQALLGNPKIKSISDELKYLVIDYTQFDEWSSDDDLEINTGIEKGYEKWEQFESDDDDVGELRSNKKTEPEAEDKKDNQEVKVEEDAKMDQTENKSTEEEVKMETDSKEQ